MEQTSLQGLTRAMPYLPSQISGAIGRLSTEEQGRIQEIRLRVGRPAGLCNRGREQSFPQGGQLIQPQLAACMKTVCEESLHSYAKELAQGYVTIAGGNRVGFCGTAVVQNGRVETVRYVSSMNFRIAGQHPGCGENLCGKLYGAGLQSVLLIGAPASGKTTMLRDICRCLGRRYRVCIVDERGELAAVSHGVPQNAVGEQTDVLDGYPKAAGMQIALRVLAPELLVCDEIGDEADTEALLQSMHAGVFLLASAHAGSIAEARERPQIRRLLEHGAFDTVVQLGTGERLGQVLGITRVRGHA